MSALVSTAMIGVGTHNNQTMKTITLLAFPELNIWELVCAQGSDTFSTFGKKKGASTAYL